MWIGCSLGLGFVLLMLEDRIYDTYAYLIYGILILLLFGTIFNPHEIKGSRSWIVLGPVSLQPAEFAKFATALALAKYIGEYTFSMQRTRNLLTVLAIILLPMMLIILQQETGSALVYLSFFLMLYREGMTGAVLFRESAPLSFSLSAYGSGTEMMPDEMTSWGEFSVLTLIVLLAGIQAWIYKGRGSCTHMYILGIGGGIILASSLFSCYVIPFNVCHLQLWLCGALCVFLFLLFSARTAAQLSVHHFLYSSIHRFFLFYRLCFQQSS